MSQMEDRVEKQPPLKNERIRTCHLPREKEEKKKRESEIVKDDGFVKR